MPTNLALDDELIRKAKEIGGFKTKKDAVTAALEEYIRRHNQQLVKHMFGKINYDSDYDYKKHRNRKG